MRPDMTRPVLVRGPALIGVLLVGAGVALTVLTGDLDIAQFLLGLVGGWCLGFAFVNAVEQLPHGLILHLAVALLLAAVLVGVVTSGGDLLDPLPEALSGVLVSLNLAAIPAAGWIWLGLLDRAVRLLRRREQSRKPQRRVPDWDREPSGDGAGIDVAAVRMPVRRVSLGIAAIVGVVGAIGVAGLIVFDDVVMRFGPRLSIILMAMVLGFPAYAILVARIRRRTVPCRIAFGNDEMRVRVADEVSVVRYTEIEHLLWRRRTDYARVELRGSGVDLSLLVALARQEPTIAAELPELPRRVFRRFELAGLTPVPTRGDDVVTFTRGGAVDPGRRRRYPGRRPLRQEIP